MIKASVAMRYLTSLSKPKKLAKAIIKAARSPKRKWSENPEKIGQRVSGVGDASSELNRKYEVWRDHFADIIIKTGEYLPQSNGCRFYRPLPMKIAIVTDIYMYNFYKDCFEKCVYVNPDAVDEIVNENIDAFIYVTCWSGINGDEWRGIQFREKQSNAFKKILDLCASKRIPTIFQSIEDPSNFEYFLPVAKMFDYVFTADRDIVPKYKESLGHDRVYFGEYGVNPKICNPIGSSRTPMNAAFFAGSYPSRYPDRCRDMETVFDSILASGGRLVIADRNFGSTHSGLQYPDRYQPYIIPSFEHRQLQSIHKLFRYNINFNSIKHSSSMCAMRVYELQAIGREILSNYAKSVFNNFPNVKTIPEKQDLTSFFSCGSQEAATSQLRRFEAVHDVLTHKTSYDVTSELMVRVGAMSPLKRPVVAVICGGSSSQSLAVAKAQCYPNIVTLDLATAMDINAWNEFKSINDVEYFCLLDECTAYDSSYVSKMLNPFKFTDCDYVTVAAGISNDVFSGPLHEYVALVPDRATTMYHVRNLSPGEVLSERKDQNVLTNGYATDPLGLKLSDRAKEYSNAFDYALSVIVPVFNNGRYLKSKCIDSLLRDPAWRMLQVVLVDDGSTDGQTLRICQQLADTYPNIVLYRFPEGGSGSASRARNKGLEIASARLVTFLDPDNEISLGGYHQLLSLFQECEERGDMIDFLSGYQAKIGGAATSYTGRHTSSRLHVMSDPQEAFFSRGRFPVISTQAAVIRRAFLEDNSIRFVEGAAGQDTLFGWQILCAAGKIAFTNAVSIFYYYERESSVTNDVNRRYFEKKLILESEQASWLRSKDLITLYVNNHLDNFVLNWYIPKLHQAPADEFNACKAVVDRILSLYGRTIGDYHSMPSLVEKRSEPAG